MHLSIPRAERKTMAGYLLSIALTTALLVFTRLTEVEIARRRNTDRAVEGALPHGCDGSVAERIERHRVPIIRSTAKGLTPIASAGFGLRGSFITLSQEFMSLGPSSRNFVMAHELGRVCGKDIFWRFALEALLTSASIWTFIAITRQHGMSLIASVLFVLSIGLVVFGLIFVPAVAVFDARREWKADIFAVKIMGYSEAIEGVGALCSLLLMRHRASTARSLEKRLNRLTSRATKLRSS